MNQISPARSVLTKCNHQTLIIYHCPGASLPENTCFIPPDTNVFIVTEIKKKEKIYESQHLLWNAGCTISLMSWKLMSDTLYLACRL